MAKKTLSWEQRKVGECFSERVESDPNGELISVTIGSGIKKFSELGRHDNSNDDKSKYKKVVIGDIAYNSMRMWQGASGYSPYNGIVSPAYTVITPFSGIDSKFFAYMFKREDMIHTFQVRSQGITSDNWNLKFPALSEIEVMLPTDISEQKSISTYLTALDNLITLHQCESSHKNGLLQTLESSVSHNVLCHDLYATFVPLYSPLFCATQKAEPALTPLFLVLRMCLIATIL